MTKLEQLLNDLCPDGVEYKELGEISDISRGGSFQKKDFAEKGVPCIHYGQIYTRYGLFADQTFSFITESVAQKQKFAKPNDIVMAVTSENMEDVCKCVVWLGVEPAAISGHSAIISHNQNPKYLAYYFHSSMFFAQKRKLAQGTKVIEVSPEKLKKVIVPVPPLEVQAEIVRVLDEYSVKVELLCKELEAELEARKKQYEYYRDSLLNLNHKIGGVIRWVKLEEIADISTGSSNTNEADEDGQYPFYVRSQEPLRKNSYEYDETAIITAGDGVGVGKVFHYVDGKYALHQRAYRIHINTDIIIPRYYFHYMRSSFLNYIEKTMFHGSVSSIRRPMLNEYPVPVPSIEVQERIVKVLDNFEAICSDLQIGLPAEIEARKKQYEYYRDLLLSFDSSQFVNVERERERERERR